MRKPKNILKINMFSSLHHQNWAAPSWFQSEAHQWVHRRQGDQGFSLDPSSFHNRKSILVICTCPDISKDKEDPSACWQCILQSYYHPGAQERDYRERHPWHRTGMFYGSYTTCSSKYGLRSLRLPGTQNTLTIMTEDWLTWECKGCLVDVV